MNRRLRNAHAIACATFALMLGAAGALPAFAAESTTGIEGVVNVNTASVEELQVLPGVGESRALQIVEMRKQRGGFSSVDELKEVRGIGDSMLDRLRGHVTLEGKTTAQPR